MILPLGTALGTYGSPRGYEPNRESYKARQFRDRCMAAGGLPVHMLDKLVVEMEEHASKDGDVDAADILRLRPGRDSGKGEGENPTYLSDLTIDTHMLYLEKHLRVHWGREVATLPPQFYTGIINGQMGPAKTKRGLEKKQPWTAILQPVHGVAHWTLLHLDTTEGTELRLTLYDSMEHSPATSERRKQEEQAIRWCQAVAAADPKVAALLENWGGQVERGNGPQQANGYQCGVHVCANAVTAALRLPEQAGPAPTGSAAWMYRWKLAADNMVQAAHHSARVGMDRYMPYQRELSRRGGTSRQQATHARAGAQPRQCETAAGHVHAGKRARTTVTTGTGQGQKIKRAKHHEEGTKANHGGDAKGKGTRKRPREHEAPNPGLSPMRTRRRTGEEKGLMEMTGTNEDDGYLYSSRPQDTDILRVGKARWISEEAWGVFANTDIRAKTSLTPYAGEVKYAHYEDIEPGESSHVISLMHGMNKRVFGLRDPRLGFGVGSLINDGSNYAPGKPAGATPNAELVISKMGDRAHVRATRDIKKGDEILMRYGRTYWHRARDEEEVSMDTNDDEVSMDTNGDEPNQRATTRLVGGGKAAFAQPRARARSRERARP